MDRKKQTTCMYQYEFNFDDFQIKSNLLGGTHLLHKLNHLNKLELHINKDHHFSYQRMLLSSV